MSNLGDLWKILETVSTVTKELERANVEIKEVRKDLHDLTIVVNGLKRDIEHFKTTSSLMFESHNKDIERAKESLAAKFEVLVATLDRKLSYFEGDSRGSRKKRRTLKPTN